MIDRSTILRPFAPLLRNLDFGHFRFDLRHGRQALREIGGQVVGDAEMDDADGGRVVPQGVLDGDALTRLEQDEPDRRNVGASEGCRSSDRRILQQLLHECGVRIGSANDRI